MKKLLVEPGVCGATKIVSLSDRAEVHLACGLTDEEVVSMGDHVHVTVQKIDDVTVVYKWTG